jgi:oligoribonuclease NrnB/cAMP/cGMP phosphodiesterase (DHH superfamily)
MSIDCSQVTKLITHDSCADGLASAMIVRDALPHVEVVFAQYNTPSLDELEATPGLLFCDITPPRERAAEFVAAGAIVLDHHKHARDIVELFGERGVFADETTSPGWSGATLAYLAVWFPRASERSNPAVKDFARLIGTRDTWQRQSPDWELANDLHAALMGLPREWWISPGGLELAMLPDTLELGKLWRAKRAETVAKIVAAGTVRFVDPSGREWAVFPDAHRHTSDVAEAMRLRGVTVTCGWFQTVADGRLSTVLSLRSDGTGALGVPLDVGALCKTFGGGGHSRAAGCTVAASDPLVAVHRVMADAT